MAFSSFITHKSLLYKSKKSEVNQAEHTASIGGRCFQFTNETRETATFRNKMRVLKVALCIYPGLKGVIFKYP